MKEAVIRSEQYITIMGWMRNIPEIETNTELMAYALIYGFSQTEGQYLTCRQSYIADWLNITRPKCNQLLLRMENKKLIKRVLAKRRGVIKTYKYCCILPSDTSTQREHDEYPKGTRTSTQREHVTSSQREHIYKYNNNNILYISRARARGNENPFNQFPQREYDFEQLEMELLSNAPLVNQDKAEADK